MISPFSSPPSSHGSTSTVSPSRTQRYLFIRPGILHSRVFPSRHRTLLLLAPSRWSSTPSTSFFPGVLTRVFCCSSLIMVCCNHGLFINAGAHNIFIVCLWLVVYGCSWRKTLYCDSVFDVCL